MYGENEYGILRYGERGLEQDNPIDDCTIDLVDYLPQFHRGENVKNVLELARAELCLSDHFAKEAGLQATVEHATYSLSDWEEMLGISIRPDANREDRRDVITAHLRGRGTTTPAMLNNTAESFSGGEVRIIEKPNEYKFTVQFVGIKGVPKNMRAFISMLEQIKPAHLTYDFKYTYTTWGLVNETWDSVNKYTWEDLRVYEGVE